MLPTKKTEKQFQLLKNNILLYGLPKVGKTTFASTINSGEGVLFLATEAGHKHLEVYKSDITGWSDFYEVGRALKKGEHDYKLLVVDTVDLAYKMCEAFVCKKHKVEHPSDMPYGKGFNLVKDEFIRVFNAFNQAGFALCFISHAKERELKSKTQSWTYMDTTLPASANTIVCGMSDFIFYVYTEDGGKRKIRTKGHKNVNAGDRSGLLPPIMDLDFDLIQQTLIPKKKEKEDDTTNT